MHVVQGELLIITSGQHAAPGVENHHRLRARFNLRVEIERDALRQLVEQGMQGQRLGVHHLFDDGKGFAAAAFHHVGGQRPRTTGEANQRHVAFQFAANGAHGVHHIAQLAFRIGDRQLINVGFAFDRRGKTRAFSGFEIEPKAHRIRNGENVRKKNGGIEREAAQRLERHFTGQLGVFAQRHKIACLRARGFVLWQIASRLAHHPHRGDINGLAQQRTQITIVLQFGHFAVPYCVSPSV